MQSKPTWVNCSPTLAERPSLRILWVLTCLAFGLLSSCSRFHNRGDADWDSKSSGAYKLAGASWNRSAAANYLDQREAWWAQWSTAVRDDGTFCVSCHTTLPYVLARGALRNEPGFPNQQDRIHEDVRKRVRLWKDINPYYENAKDGGTLSAESRATEAVLNAVILSSFDADAGRLSEDTLAAFQNLWALQTSGGPDKGAWPWHQFALSPWENCDSVYYGATLAALAVGTAPENYQNWEQNQANLNRLREYLRREFPHQPLLNKIFLLWVSTKLDGLLSRAEQNAIIGELLEKQREDGGWNLYSLTWSWRHMRLSILLKLGRRSVDETKQDTGSDGLATGLIVFVLHQAGVNKENEQLRRGRQWLIANQDQTNGMWVAASLNKRRDPSSNVGLFMSDAATAFAVLALNATAP